MNLYLTAAGRYVGTQADAKAAGKGWKAEEVPTDKPGLIAYLNSLTRAGGASVPFGEAEDPMTYLPWRDNKAGEPVRSTNTETASELPAIEAIQSAGADEASHILQASLERVAELGEPARASLEERVMAFNGYGTGEPSPFFQRGAMLLAVLALGEIAGIRTAKARKTWAGR